MRIKPKFAALFWLTAVAALLAIAVGASTAGASTFKTSTFPVTFLGEGVGVSTFLSTELSSVSCTNSHSKGEVKSATLAVTTIYYLNDCLLNATKPIAISKEPCPNIKTHELDIVPLSKIGGSGTKTGLLVQAFRGTETITTFNCTGSNKVEVKVRGSVICESTPIGSPVTKGQIICKAGTRHGSQEFTTGALPEGKTVTAGLIAESTLSIFKLTERESQTTTENITYAAAVEQTKESLPNETTITGFGETREEVPVINWGHESPITTKGCKGGKVIITIEAENTETHKIESREATLTESPTGSGTFSGNIPIMKPLHGKASLTITISGCEHSSEDIVILIVIYIDPSGTVVDGNHEDAPVGEATVTLLSSPTETGTYTAVENGSVVMSEMNRVNPDLSRANGGFGWETIEGWYKVDATKTGCGAASTAAFHVPPPQENC